ncbi:flagellar protein G [Archaeoglobales archaeon]|nr:MAG: flagellar protein G [Archaeoglobales archaeon]
MAGESASHIILFITTVLLASSVSAVTFVTIQKMTIDLEFRGKAISEYLATDFEIINDPSMIPQIDGKYIFYIKNTGNTIIPFTNETITVLINGSVVRFTTNVYSLKPGDVGEVIVYDDLNSGDHRITLILHNGLSKSLDFKVE